MRGLNFLAATAAGLAISSGALAAGDFQGHYTDCVDRFAPAGKAAQVTLECTASSGKLAACKVVDNSAPGEGFDKAAICVAAFLPMGAKSGQVRVPVHFQGA